MIKAAFGTKSSMTQAWDKAGVRMPVTIINVIPMTVTQVKTKQKDGYQAIQVGFGHKKWQRVNKPLKGHLKKSMNKDAGAGEKEKTAPVFLREVRIDDEVSLGVGDAVGVDKVFEVGDVVNVRGKSKGRGFAGVIKRWGFAGGPRTHGQSDRERAPGSIGQGTDPGRVHKGKKMPGHYGASKVTVRNLVVVKVDEKKGEIWLKGQVPGFCGAKVRVAKVGQDKKFPGLFDAAEAKEMIAEDKVPNKEKPVKKEKESQDKESKVNEKKKVDDKEDVKQKKQKEVKEKE